MAGEIIRSQNLLALIKLETTEGVDAAPTAADAILVEAEGFTFTPGNRFIESTEAQGSLDVAAGQPAGAPATISFRARLRGAGAVYTALIRPPLHPVLRACAMKDTFQAAVSAAALTAGGASSATLPAGFPGTAQALRGGFTQVTAGAAAHVGKFPLVTDYTAARVATFADSFSPALTTSEQLGAPAQVIYAPVSARADVPSITLWVYQDGLLYKFRGLRGSMTIEAATGGPPRVNVTLSGIFSGVSDAALPSATPVAIAAPLFAQGAAVSDAYLLNRQPLPIANFGLDLGLEVQNPEDPNTPDGFGTAQLTRRNIRVTADPLMTLIANRDMITALRNGTLFTSCVRMGAVAGNRIGITMPALQAVERSEGDRNALKTESLTFQATGADAGAFIAFA